MGSTSVPIDELDEQAPAQASSVPIDDLDATPPAQQLTPNASYDPLASSTRTSSDPITKAAQGRPRIGATFSDVVGTPYTQPDLQTQAAVARMNSPQTAASKAAGMPLADVSGRPHDPQLDVPMEYNPKTGMPFRPSLVPEADAPGFIPGAAVPRLVERTASGIGDLGEAFTPQFNPASGKYERTPAGDEAKKRQMYSGASDVVSGVGGIGMQVAPIAVMNKPVATAASFALGYGASEASGAVAHKMGASPEAEELTRNLAFFLPSVAGTLSGLKTGSVETPEGKFSAASVLGGKARAGVASTPDAYSGRVKVGDTQFEVNIPRNRPAQPPEPSEAAKALASFEQASGNPDFQPPPPPPVDKGPQHLTPDIVQGVSDTIMQAPAEKRPDLMVEAHANMSKWMMGRGTFTGPDHKIYTVDSENQAKRLASKFINDEVDRKDAEQEQVAKATEEAKQAAEVAPVSGKPPAGSGMTTDTAAVENVAQKAQLHPEQKPAVMVKEEPPKQAAALAKPPAQVQPQDVAPIGTKDKESDRTILQPSTDVMQNERLASQAAPELATKLSHIAAGVDGATFDRLRPQKELQRVDEKVDDAGKPPETVPDYLAAQIAADSPQAKDSLIQELQKNFKVVSVEDSFLEGRPKLAGYPSANVQVMMGNGLTAEVQIVPREIQESANESHKYYTAGREAELRGDHAEKDKQFAEATKLHNEAMDKFRERNGIEKPAQHEFASTQINVDPQSDLGQAHAQAVAKIPQEHVGKEGLEKTPHVTVRYGLKDDSPAAIEKIKQAAANIQPFEVPMGKTEVFPATKHSSFDHPVVARLKTTPELKALRSAVEGAGAFKEDNFPEYKPHVTLGYIKPEFAEQYKGGSQLEGRSVPVKEIVVTKRDGSQEVIPLGGQAGHSVPIDELEAAGHSVPLDELDKIERRTNPAERKRIEDMSHDEARHTLRTDELTGLKSRRAFLDDQHANPAKALGTLDLDGLKAVNDKLGGHDSGDLYIQEVARLLKGSGLDLYRTGGDEFYAPGNSTKELTTQFEKASQIIQDHTFVFTLGDGSRWDVRGLGLSYGVGTDWRPGSNGRFNVPDAEKALTEHKQQRFTEGYRGERGDFGRNVELRQRQKSQGSISEGQNPHSVPIEELDQPATPDVRKSALHQLKEKNTAKREATAGELRQAHADWAGGRAYLQNGSYWLHGESRGFDGQRRIAPWNKLAKQTYADNDALHAAAKAAFPTREAAQEFIYPREQKAPEQESEPIAQFDEAVKHTGAEVKEGTPSSAFAEKIKAATHLEPANDAELKEKLSGAPYQREYFKAALEPALTEWKAKLTDADFQKATKTTNHGLKQVEGKGQLYIKVPNDGHFLINNTPYAINKALNGARAGFTPPKQQEPRLNVPRSPKEFDNEKYIVQQEKELADLKDRRKGELGNTDRANYLDEQIKAANENLTEAKKLSGAPVKGKPGERGFARMNVPAVVLSAPFKAAQEKVSDFIEKRKEASHYTTQARLLEEGLAGLDRKYEADVLDTRNMLRSVNKAFTPEEEAAVYHAVEAGRDAGLSDKEKALKNDFVKPIQKINQDLREELAGFGWGDLYPEGGYIHRIVEGKPGRLESAAKGQGGGKGNLLSKTTPSTKERRMFALEDADGYRMVVHKADGRLTGFDQGKPVDMGSYKALKPGGEFTSKDGQTWTLKNATTKEIEDATNLRYYKNAMAVTTLDNLELQRAVNAARFLESFKSRPDFDTVAIKADAGDQIPQGWKQSQIPQFRGYAFEPRTREVLDDLHDRMTNYEPPGFFEKIGDFLQTSILLNPLMHVANMADIWTNERGVLRSAQVWKADNSFRAGMKALKAVTTRNEDYLNALRAGAPLMSHKLLVRDLNRAFQEVLSGEAAKDKGLAAKLRESMALPADSNPIEILRGASHSGAFMSNDVFLLQSVYDKMESSGMNFEASLRQTMKTFPEYRVPTRVADQKWIADLMKNRLTTWFSGYHYGKWRAFRNMAADSVRPGASAEDRTWALSRIAMLGLLVAVVYPAYQQLVKKMSGDPNARVKRFGLSGTVQNMIDVHSGKKDITQAAESEVTPSALLKGAVETATNRDSYTGDYVRNPNDPAGTQVKQTAEHFAKSAVGPYAQYQRYKNDPDGLKKFLWSQVGVTFPKSETQTKAELLMNNIRREHYAPRTPEEQQEFEDKMQRIAEGHLTLDERRKKIQDLVKNEFQKGMGSFTYEQARQVYDVATPEERGMMSRLMLEKRFNTLRKAVGGGQ